MMSHIVRSGMFGYISGPVTTTQYRAERTERRYRKRALNSHRPWVFVQDRMMGWVIDRLRAGWAPPDDSGAGLRSSSRTRVASQELVWFFCSRVPSLPRGPILLWPIGADQSPSPEATYARRL